MDADYPSTGVRIARRFTIFAAFAFFALGQYGTARLAVQHGHDRRLQHKQNQLDQGARGSLALPPDWEPLRVAFTWIIEEAGRGSWSDPDGVSDLIRQAAISDELKIRGYQEISKHGAGPRFDSIRSEVPPEYWQKYTIELTVTLGGGADDLVPETRALNEFAEHGPHYRGLQIDMRRVKQIWG